jgi:antitoxin MazE
MQSRIAKWGNSCGIRLPSSIIKTLNMNEGTTVDIHLEKDHIVVSKSRTYRLNDLLSRITPSNKHSEVATGKSLGEEIW